MKTLIIQNEQVTQSVKYKTDLISDLGGRFTIMDIQGLTDVAVQLGFPSQQSQLQFEDIKAFVIEKNLQLLSLHGGQENAAPVEIVAIETDFAITNGASLDAGVTNDAEVSTITAIADLGVKEQATVVCIAEGSVKEIDTFLFDTVANTTGGDFFIFYYNSTQYAAVWLDKNGDSTTDLPSGAIYTAASVKIRVDVSALTTAAQVGTAVYTALGLNATVVAACDLADSLAGTVTITNKLYLTLGGAPADYAKAEGGGGSPTTTRTATGATSALSGKYFTCNTPSIAYYVWYDVTGATSIDPAPGGGKIAVPVTITRGMTNAQVATATAAAIDALAGFTCAAPGAATITIVNLIAYNVTNAADVDTTQVVTTTVAGVASAVEGTYFILSSPTVAYYAWFNAGNSTDPAPVGKTGIAITYTYSDSANTMADNIASALDALASLISANPAAAVVTITNATKGAAVDIGAGTSGLAVAITNQGTTSVAYSATIEAEGGNAPYIYTVTDGDLPDGLTLNANTGVLSGTPTVADTFVFTITATDFALQTTETEFTLVVAA